MEESLEKGQEKLSGDMVNSSRPSTSCEVESQWISPAKEGQPSCIATRAERGEDLSEEEWRRKLLERAYEMISDPRLESEELREIVKALMQGCLTKVETRKLLNAHAKCVFPSRWTSRHTRKRTVKIEETYTKGMLCEHPAPL